MTALAPLLAGKGNMLLPASRAIWTIAQEIRRDWKKPNYAAVPYLQAMANLTCAADSYGSDSARSCIAYFLANAGSWRGDTAKRVKAELKSLLAPSKKG